MNENIKQPDEIKGSDEKERDPGKRREIVKTILIIFLAVLLVLTFFSNTILNRSLAEISTERATSGKLTERVRGSGIVESNQVYDVTVESNLVIDTIMVKTGKEVSKGDVLFTVSSEENAELSAAQDALDELELAYQKAQLAVAADYSSENQAINNARADLNTAIARCDAAANNQGNVQAAKNDYNNNKSSLAYQTKLQTKLQSTISAIDMDEYSAAPADYSGDLIMSKNKVTGAESEYTAAQQIYTAMLAAIGGGQTDAEEPEEESAAAVTEEELEAARLDAEDKKAAYDAAKTEYDNYKYWLRGELVSQLTDCENEIDWLTAQISAYEDSLSSGETMSLDALNEDVTAKQRALDELISSLKKTQTDNEHQSQLDKLDLEAQKKAIDKQKEKIEKLKNDSDITEITSKYSGVVSSVMVQPGDTTVPDSPLASIDIADEGYTVRVTVDAEKSKKLKKGTEAEVVNNWNGNVQAVLTDIKNDTVSGSKNRILVFEVTGDVESGTNLDLSIPCGSGNYDCIVPKSAVYQDKDGYFVLTVTSKSSPLGNRYYAQRVNVEVIVSDETSSAVQGAITANDYVITAASKPVSPKDQVRMKDN